MEARFSVSASGGGEFGSIGAAVEAATLFLAGRRAAGDAGASARIAVGPGEYREKVAVRAGPLRIEGAGAASTRLVWDDHASRPLPDGERMGTFNSYTLYVGAPDVSVSGLTIENDAGDGRAVGQAVAVYADADRLSFRDCRLLARQDTLCTGPLPKNPVPKGINLIHPVAGLGADEPVLPFRQAYRNCLIAGDVDFIFGSALAVFEGCEIRSLPRGAEPAYVAAPSTYPGQAAGFVFSRCRLTYEPGAAVAAAAAGPVYLCRPWRATGQCAFLDCELGPHIAPEGWDDWEKPESHGLGRFSEYRSSGPGAADSRRPSWVRILSAEEAAAFAPMRVRSSSRADTWR
jgi:pectinesterase